MCCNTALPNRPPASATRGILFLHGVSYRSKKKGNQILTATYFFFPKKHIPMLFHSGGLSGAVLAITRYLERATSKSPCACIMLPAAKVAFERRQEAEELHFPRCRRRQRDKVNKQKPSQEQAFNFFRCFLPGAAKTNSGEQVGTLESLNIEQKTGKMGLEPASSCTISILETSQCTKC